MAIYDYDYGATFAPVEIPYAPGMQAPAPASPFDSSPALGSGGGWKAIISPELLPQFSPTQDPAEIARRKPAFLEILAHPAIRNALMAFGTSMMRDRPRGTSSMDQIARALYGANVAFEGALEAERKGKMEAEQEARQREEMEGKNRYYDTQNEIARLQELREGEKHKAEMQYLPEKQKLEERKVKADEERARAAVITAQRERGEGGGAKTQEIMMLEKLIARTKEKNAYGEPTPDATLAQETLDRLGMSKAQSDLPARLFIELRQNPMNARKTDEELWGMVYTAVTGSRKIPSFGGAPALESKPKPKLSYQEWKAKAIQAGKKGTEEEFRAGYELYIGGK